MLKAYLIKLVEKCLLVMKPELFLCTWYILLMAVFLLVCPRQCLFFGVSLLPLLPCALPCFDFFFSSCSVHVWLDLIGQGARISFVAGKPAYVLPVCCLLHSEVAPDLVTYYMCCLLFAPLGQRCCM